MHNPMTRTQKLTLFCSIVCFALTLYSFMTMDSWVFLTCFILYAIFSLLFGFLAIHGSQGTPDEIQELTDRLENVRAEWKDDSDRLKEQISEKDTEIQSLKDAAAEKDAETESLKKNVAALEAENLELRTASAETDTEVSSVLPQFLPEASESTTVDLVQIIKSVVREFHDDAAKAGLTVRVSCSEENILVKADQNILRIMFRNIVDNSIKYMNRHGSLVITLSMMEDDIFIVLKDTGEGLDSEETRHIFELNYQGSNRVSGNGLGLFQAKAIVDYYGGTIYARSGFGKGMGIYIQLPTSYT